MNTNHSFFKIQSNNKSAVLITALLMFLGLTVVAQPVKVTGGMVQGVKQNGITVYKGIPFAAPPVGDLRWKAPQPVKPWKGVLKATKFSASPYQSKPIPFACWTEEFIAPPEPLSEDCLYLNIWTGAKSPKEKRPVLVWIYGGGFVSGSAACSVYDGMEMAKRGIVVVSINYRVGIFGFMAHPELSKESPNGVSGNYGIMDQIAALKWVRANIAKFGGDINNVAIAGQSAGSMSVSALVASPLTKTLFQKAIAQSGGLLGSRFIADLKTAEKEGTQIQEKAKLTSIADLRKLSSDEVLKLTGRFSPNLDGYVLPKNIKEAFEKHEHQDVPVLTGWVTGDGALFGNQLVKASDFKKNVETQFGDKAAEFLQLFPAETDSQATASQQKWTLMGFAGAPSINWAKYNRAPVYVYEYTHVPAPLENFPDYGAFHTSEVPFAFHNLHLWKRKWREVDYKVQEVVNQSWVNFLTSYNPNGLLVKGWYPYNSNTAIVYILNENPHPENGLYKKEVEMVSGINN